MTERLCQLQKYKINLSVVEFDFVDKLNFVIKILSVELLV